MRSTTSWWVAPMALIVPVVASYAADLPPGAPAAGRALAAWTAYSGPAPAGPAVRGGDIGYTLVSLPNFRQRDAGMSVGRSDRVALAAPPQCFFTWPCDGALAHDAAHAAGTSSAAGSAVRLFADGQDQLLPRIAVAAPPDGARLTPAPALLARL